MTTSTTESTLSSTPAGEIVAGPDNWYRIKWIAMSLGIIIYCGGFFLYDGFIRYPQNNAKIAEVEKQIETEKDKDKLVELHKRREPLGAIKTNYDLNIQKAIGFISLPLGLWLLMNTLKKTRGQIRLSGQTVHVPGHPAVPFEAITSIDNRIWDKKGIAYVNYSLPEGRNGQFTLDDFAYQRDPLDKIYDAIVKYVSPEDAEDSDDEVEKTAQTKSPEN
jgi:hypothetical protein